MSRFRSRCPTFFVSLSLFLYQTWQHSSQGMNKVGSTEHQKKITLKGNCKLKSVSFFLQMHLKTHRTEEALFTTIYEKKNKIRQHIQYKEKRKTNKNILLYDSKNILERKIKTILGCGIEEEFQRC